MSGAAGGRTSKGGDDLVRWDDCCTPYFTKYLGFFFLFFFFFFFFCCHGARS